MKRFIQTIILGLVLTATPAPAGWFSKDREMSQPVDPQRIAVEQRLQEAQQRISAQEQRITQLHTTTIVIAAGAVVLLVIGVALGSKARRT